MMKNVTIDTKRMRIMIGVLGMLLPWLVALITLSWPESISITYYSVFAVGTFMVVLGSAGILLINYKGYSKIDDISATIAGIFGILVCVFPMKYIWDPSIQTGVFHLRSDISDIFHSISAVIFFATLSFMSFFLFTKTNGNMTKQKKIKNVIYKICGIGMMSSFLLFLLKLIPGFKCYNLTWIIEMIALTFFGVSWIIKSDAIPMLQDNKHVVSTISIGGQIIDEKCENNKVDIASLHPNNIYYGNDSEKKWNANKEPAIAEKPKNTRKKKVN